MYDLPSFRAKFLGLSYGLQVLASLMMCLGYFAIKRQTMVSALLNTNDKDLHGHDGGVCSGWTLVVDCQFIIRHSYILRVVLVIIIEFHWFMDTFGKDALCIIHQ